MESVENTLQTLPIQNQSPVKLSGNVAVKEGKKKEIMHPTCTDCNVACSCELVKKQETQAEKNSYNQCYSKVSQYTAASDNDSKNTKNEILESDNSQVYQFR